MYILPKYKCPTNTMHPCVVYTLLHYRLCTPYTLHI